MYTLRMLYLLALLMLGSLLTGTVWAQSYYVYVAAESEDKVSLVRFDGQQAEVMKTMEVGTLPGDMEGPHGLTVSPDGTYWFVTLAHGSPYGKVVKYTTGTDEKVGEAEVGLFPASMQISPVTRLLYVVNSNRHGKREPSSVSVIDPAAMTEVARTTTGVMPLGSRLTPDGLHQYSVAMMDDMLYEIAARTFEVTRTLNTASGSPEVTGMKAVADSSEQSMHMDHGQQAPRPTWVQPHPTKTLVYVANNGTDEIIEVDLNTWTVARHFKTGPAPYNLDVTPDGKYVIFSEKEGGSTGAIDLALGEQVVSVPNSRKGTHGVVISPDSRYAFISVEGVGGEPGAVDVIDLQTMERIATAEVGKEASGIAFWKMEK